MHFFYYMYGESVNYLRVLINDTIHTREIWRRTGNKGQRWIYGEVSLVNPRPYQVTKQATLRLVQIQEPVFIMHKDHMNKRWNHSDDKEIPGVPKEAPDVW